MIVPRYLKQLSYVAEKRSYAYIARESGIPYRTVLAMRAGKIKISSEFARTMRNTFQREAYGRLRKTGFSTQEARRWSWYAPERVVLQEMSLKLKIAELTTGSVSAHILREGLPITGETVSELYDKYYEDIRQGIATSPLPIEDIMVY